MTDDLASKLQIAADMIHDELHRRGTHVNPADCLAIARRLHDIWHDRVEVLDLPPGEVARRFRERYGDLPMADDIDWYAAHRKD